jgi:hypothetical protein
MLELENTWEGLDAAFLELEAECASVIRGLTVEAWGRVLNTTPQFYGRAVASWSYSLGSPVFVDRSDDVWFGQDWRTEDNRKSRGSTAAIGIANSFNLGKDHAFKLGDTVWFANGVDHGEGPYSQALEDATISLRSVNRPGHMVKRAIDYIQAKYGEDVKPSSAARLKGLTIGF